MNDLRKTNKRLKKSIEKVKKLYEEELEIFEDMEPATAPSGEWAEYNVHYIMQETRVFMIEEILQMLEEKE